MNKKKVILISSIVAIVLLVALAAGLFINHQRKLAEEAERLRIYNETYLVMDGNEYRRDSVELDLSGMQITEIEKLQELTALQKLDLRNTQITIAQYDMLRAALPDCEILWSVPFQGGYYDCATQELTLESLSEADLEAFSYLTRLTAINADACRDYEALFALMAAYPEIAVTYSVDIGELTVGHTETELTVIDPDAEELLSRLSLLPEMKTVTLEGNLPSNEALIALKEAFPQITFVWNFSVCGVQTNSLAEFLDLSNIKMESTEELEAALDCFYQLEKVDMIKCGFSNSEMEALNLRHPATSFVWKVNVSGVTVRTDIKYFMPYKLGIGTLRDLSNLRYCTEIEVLDFGHKSVPDISYLEYMPNLRYLLLLGTKLTDLSLIGNCTSLEYLELSMNPIVDFWPLTNLTNLKCLNLSETPYYGPKSYGSFGDITPLLQMTWLDRLWLNNSRLGDEGRAIMYAALPNVEMVFRGSGSTERGWRHSPGYYEMRDIIGMWYMIG